MLDAGGETIICIHSTSTYAHTVLTVTTRKANRQPPSYRITSPRSTVSDIDHDLGATGTSHIRQLPSDVTKH